MKIAQYSFLALSSPLYQNVQVLKNDAKFQSVDELPLPPPPPPPSSTSSVSAAEANWSNQERANTNFPPPPPEAENYSYGSDMKGNQFHHVDTAVEGNLYANLPAHQVTVSIHKHTGS